MTGIEPRSGQSGGLLIAAILLLAFNLRLSVNALGSVLAEIRADLAISATAAGVLLALPPLVFAFAGIGTPALAARLGNHRMVVTALLISVAGQLLRALGPGTVTLFGGTLLSLIGLAIGNVLMPGLIRQHFPHRVTTVTALYVTILSLGATLGSGVTIPIQNLFDGTWRSGFLTWTVVAVLSLLPWVLVSFRRGDHAALRRKSSVPLRALVGSGLAWTMALFFAIQTAQVYVTVGWLGQVLLDAGVDAVEMGALLALGPAVGIALALVIPNLMQRQTRIPALMIGFGACYVVGYIGLLIAPLGGAWVWMFFIGLGAGTFPTVLTLLALRASSADGAIALSAFTQCVGYLLGSLGPLVFGFVHDLNHSWRPSVIMMTVLVVPMVAVGLRLARTRYLEDEITLT